MAAKIIPINRSCNCLHEMVIIREWKSDPATLAEAEERIMLHYNTYRSRWVFLVVPISV